MLKRVVFLFACLIIGQSSAYADGVLVGATRLIYNESQSQASVAISNPDDIAYLIQSWVSKTPTDNTPLNDIFVTTPPIFRLDSKTDNSVRVVYTGATLPQDRESVFWLNIKVIPSSDPNDKRNVLTITVRTQIKLFYRPSGLKGNPADAYKALTFSVKNGKLEISNPSAYNVPIKELKVNGVNVKDAPMVLPFSKLVVDKNVSVGNSVSWNAINDSGGATDIVKSVVK